ncbi:unnamed protein product [marine sediment metagenome]|uniref:Uncharacterized protein n=1 Tax=marine sediment metagenome TaxID=412755 RepID=X1QZ00_9ZZZZ
MGKQKTSKGGQMLMHKRNFSNRRRLSPKAVAQVKDSILGIISDITQGHETEFVPTSIYDVMLRLRRDYDTFLTFRQVGYYMRKLVDEQRIEKEVHNVDRTAKHWSDQYSRYRLTQQPPVDPDTPHDSTAGPDPGRPTQGSDSDTPLE